MHWPRIFDRPVRSAKPTLRRAADARCWALLATGLRRRRRNRTRTTMYVTVRAVHTFRKLLLFLTLNETAANTV